MNHLKSRPRVKKRYGRGCFSSFALSLPDNPHDYCILFPSAQTLGQVWIMMVFAILCLQVDG